MPGSRPRRAVALIDRRIGLIFGIFALVLAAGAARALYLDTVKASALRAAATGEHIQTIPILPLRGAITDRTGVMLALSETGDQIVADPLLIRREPDPARAAAQLAPLLGEPEHAVLTQITRPRSGYVVLSRDVPVATSAKITALGINGINAQPTERRVYPRADEAAQILGWVPTSRGTGAGVEYEFNRQLTGSGGTERIVKDQQGRAIQVRTTRPMVPGATLRLTLSAPLQAEVQRVLAGVGQQYNPKGATAIVTDPQTDQILALASWPSYNANQITSADVQGTGGHWPAVEDQAVDLTYEPGSTFKVVTVAGALEDGLVSPSTEFHIPPYLNAPGGYTISDAEHHGWEYLSVGNILKYSSNIGADLIAQRMGANNFGAWVNRFGFGKPTGVDLPGEEQGIIRQPSGYSGLSMYNLPFGQGESVTPMQMVQAYDTLADGGILRKPQIVAQIGGHKLSEPRGRRIISRTVALEVRKMLRGVLTDGGTASGAAINGYDLAGKTGTANVSVNGHYSDTKYVASFIGMVPASKPKLVVAVVVDEPHRVIYGGSVAAPAFQQIVGWAVPYFGINPCPDPCPPSAYHGGASSTP